MRILESLKRFREMTRLRAHARRAPSPATFGALAERYLAHGRLENALRVAETGLAKFPDSERLAQVRLFAKKKTLSGRIKRLRQDVARRPSPLAYTNLAQLYRELDSEDDALEMASECAERFPLNEQPYLIQGEIRLERFLRDQIAKDAVMAEAALRKVTRINAHSVKAHLLLAELYYMAGDISGCRRHLRAVLTVAPTERAVQRFLKDLGTAAVDEAEDDGVDFAERATVVEENGTFPNDPEAFPALLPHARVRRRQCRPHVDVEKLRAAIARAGTEIGISNAAILDGSGVVLADHASLTGLSRQSFAELVKCIRETADDASRRMDTGALVRAEIGSPGGNLTVVRLRDLTIAALYSEPLRADRVWEMLQDFIARNLTTGKEVARA